MGWLWKRKKTIAIVDGQTANENALQAIKGLSGDEALQELQNAAGEILKACGYDEVWPPRNGPNVLHKNPDPEIQKNVELQPPAHVLAAEVFVHCIAARNSIKDNDISKAIFNSIMATSRYEQAYARYTHERDTVSAMKQRRGDGWKQGADDELLNKRLKWYQEAIAKNLIPGKYMHSEEKGVDINSVVSDDYAYMRKYISDNKDRFV